MDITVTLVAADALGAATIPTKVAGLRRLMLENPDAQVSAPLVTSPQHSAIESKAEPISLAAVAIACLTSGAVVALINAIRTVHPDARDTSIAYELAAEDGKGRLKFNATGLTREQATLLIQKWNDMATVIKHP